ncbi:MAG: hypothetical protein WEC33_09250 [Dehalococcoidia bacterium]
MATFLWVVVRRWDGLERGIGIGLYAFRMVGFVAFEISGARGVLLLFPNVFEFWFLFVAGLRHWRPGRRLSGREAGAVLAPLVGLKLVQEYALHTARWLDSFTAVEAVEAIWDWAWVF